MNVQALLGVALVAAVIIFPATTEAGPLIEVDSAEHNLGIIREGEKPVVKTVFKFRNTGDSALILRNVRPGCGCTTVEVDTTILPGTEGSITSQLNMVSLSEGDFVKTITVISNARNTPSLKLTMRGTYVTVFEVAQGAALQLSGAKGRDTGAIVTIRSSKKLAIEKAEFKFGENNGGVSYDIAIPLTFKASLRDSAGMASKTTAKKKPDSVRAKPFVYDVRVFFNPKVKENKWGDVYLTTSLKEKKEVKVPAMLEPGP